MPDRGYILIIKVYIQIYPSNEYSVLVTHK